MLNKRKRVRDFTWKDYDISVYRRRELENFCLQYNEKKNKLRYGLSARVSNGMPRGNLPGNPVEKAALENVINERDCRMIEEAAKATHTEIWRHILKSVTNDLSFEMIEYDEELGRITMGKTDFYGYRRLFFKKLDCIKNGDKLGEVV